MDVKELIMGQNMPADEANHFTQDILGIEKAVNGLICTKDKRYIKILEVTPINFFTRSAREQDAIIKDFMAWLAICPARFQIKVASLPGNQKDYVEKLNIRMVSDKDFAVADHVQSYSKLLTRLGNNDAVTRKFYLIYEYEPKTEMQRVTDETEIANIMYDIYLQIKTSFSQMENDVWHLSDDFDVSRENRFTGELLYEFLNPVFSKKHPFEERVRRINRDTELVCESGDVKPDFASYIAPMSLDFGHKNFYIMDGKYYSTIAIADNGYPDLVYGGWLSLLTNLNPGESLDFFVRKESIDRMRSVISRRLRFSQAELMEKSETQKDYEQMADAVAAAAYIKSAMADGELPFYICTLITISGTGFEELMKRRSAFIESVIMRGLDINELDYKQEYAFKSTLPLNRIHSKLEREIRRNITSSGLAGSYPFTSYEMKDDSGFLFGVNIYNNSLAFLNPFDQKKYTNANMTILGTSGSGKTYTEQLLALRLRELGHQVFILAPYKAHEYKRACDSVKGSFVKISSDSKNYINLLDIRPVSSETNTLLQGEEASENTIWVADKAKTIITFCTLLIRDFSGEEEQRLDTAIINTYKKFGITEDNNSLYKNPANKREGLKPMPVIEDLYNTLKEMEGCERIVSALSQFITGSARSFNGQTNVDLNNKYIVFDVEHLDNRLVSAGMFLVLDFIMGRIREDVLERKMVFIDEGWKLMGAGANEKAAEYVQSIFKVIRGYNGGACIATQDIHDFFALDGGKYGNAVIANSKIKVLLKMEESEAKYVKNTLNLTYEETRNLSKYSRGECLFCANNDHVEVKVTGSDYLGKLVTTNPDEVRKVVAEIKKHGKILPD